MVQLLLASEAQVAFRAGVSLPAHTFILGEEPLLLVESEQNVLHAHRLGQLTDAWSGYRIDSAEELTKFILLLKSASLFEDPPLLIRISAQLFQQVKSLEGLKGLLDLLRGRISVIVIAGLSLLTAKKVGLMKCIDPNSLVLNCVLPSARALPSWMMRRAAQQGADLSLEAAKYLAQQAHAHLIGVGHCITILSLARFNSTITLEDVKGVWQQTGLPQLGHFLNNTLQGNIFALKQLRLFCQHQKSVHYLFAGLERLMVALWELQQLSSGAKDDWAQRHRIWPYQQKLYLSAAQRISASQLKSGMSALCSAAEALFKPSGIDTIPWQLERIWWNCFAAKAG